MNKFELTSEEKSRILEMHKSFKKIIIEDDTMMDEPYDDMAVDLDEESEFDEQSQTPIRIDFP